MLSNQCEANQDGKLPVISVDLYELIRLNTEQKKSHLFQMESAYFAFF